MFCYLILLFSISVSGASVLNRIEQTRKDSIRLSPITVATRDIADVDEQKDQEVLSRGIRDLLYWNRVLNSLKGKNFRNFLKLPNSFDEIRSRFSRSRRLRKKVKIRPNN